MKLFDRNVKKHGEWDRQETSVLLQMHNHFCPIFAGNGVITTKLLSTPYFGAIHWIQCLTHEWRIHVQFSTWFPAIISAIIHMQITENILFFLCFMCVSFPLFPWTSKKSEVFPNFAQTQSNWRLVKLSQPKCRQYCTSWIPRKIRIHKTWLTTKNWKISFSLSFVTFQQKEHDLQTVKMNWKDKKPFTKR